MLETTTNLPNTKAEHIQPALLQVQGNDNDMLEGVMEVGQPGGITIVFFQTSKILNRGKSGGVKDTKSL